METKKCKWCGEEKSLDQYYQSQKVKSNGEKYTYYNPECKVCTKNNSKKWMKENPERYKVFYTNRNQKPYFKEKMRKAANTQRLTGKHKEWQQNNPEKLKEYRLKREAHKQHDITDQEWYACLDYFNNSCAYCGLSEQDQFELYKERFHMEHVDHKGSNYIENCVPSCTKCNVRKHDFEFKDWYNENNEVYSKRRYNKIINWMTKECFKVLNIQ